MSASRSTPASSRALELFAGGCIGLAIAIAMLANHAPAQAASADIAIVNVAYQPSTRTIAVGDTVTWTASTANGLTPHTSTSDNLTPLWDSGTLNAGQSFSFTFATPGDYAFHCSYHPLSMKGTIHVVGGQGTYLPLLQR